MFNFVQIKKNVINCMLWAHEKHVIYEKIRLILVFVSLRVFWCIISVSLLRLPKNYISSLPILMLLEYSLAIGFFFMLFSLYCYRAMITEKFFTFIRQKKYKFWNKVAYEANKEGSVLCLHSMIRVTNSFTILSGFKDVVVTSPMN